MANIKPFIAIRPNAALVAEPMYYYTPEHQNHDFLRQLLQDGDYTIAAEPAIYIYEVNNLSGRQTGVWTLTDLADHFNGNIITHESTLYESEEQIRFYREHVGLEGAPILLTYPVKHDINMLIERAVSSQQPEIFYHCGNAHKLWQVTAPYLIEQFEKAFKNLNKVYVADGHHRLAAAAALHNKTHQWISTLYVSVSQLRIREFHRLVIPGKDISGDKVLKAIQQYFHTSAIPNNVAYRPDKNHRLGLFLQDTWYQLDLKKSHQTLQAETDVHILQEYILKPVFGIEQPQTDPKLQVFSATEGWQDLLCTIANDKTSVAFTLFPMTVDKLIEQAEKQTVLPPKSTWIEPKVPYGLLMYSNRMPEYHTP